MLYITLKKYHNFLSISLLLFSAILLIAVVKTSVFAQLPGELNRFALAGGDNTPISYILNPDGSIKRGVTGSFDPKGFRMLTGPDGAPRFVADNGRAENNSLLTAGCNDGWDDRFWTNGPRGYVRAIAVVSNGDIYIGGGFTAVGNVLANGIVKWDGSSWSALGSGVSSGFYYPLVNAIAVLGTDIYVGGEFTTAGDVTVNHIAKWDGTRWSALGSGVNGSVRAIAVSGTDIYVGGAFTQAGGFTANSIAKWNGTSWSALGSGVSGDVNAIAISGTDVYIGGQFPTAGGIPGTVGIAKWNGTTWSSLGSGVYGIVYAIAVSGNDVFIGGDFYQAGGVPGTVGIAKWNGSSWSALGSGVSNGQSNAPVLAIAVSGNYVYVGGVFTTAGGVTVNNIAKWDGANWSPVGTGIAERQRTPLVFAIAVSGNDVYVGGQFSLAGGVSANNIAKWNAVGFSPIGPTGLGVNSGVQAITVSGTDVYVGGSFTTAGEVPANGIAKWDGSSWSALGSGVSNGQNYASVYAIAVSGNDVYIGGYFTTAGGITVNNIAKWDGSIWSSLGSGVSGSAVYAVAASGTDIYVGGEFTTVGGVPAKNVAKWNGTSWSALGSGTDYIVHSIGVSGTDIYVGGDFSDAGGVPGTVGIAKWNGSQWSALGSGVTLGRSFEDDFGVTAIAISGTDVYAGGLFSSADGVAGTSGIAKWNGSSWSSLGGGFSVICDNSGCRGGVSSLAINGLDVYGAADVAGGIAKWNGSGWSSFSSGVGGAGFPSIDALAVSGSDLYVGGYFSIAGCHAASNFSRYSLQTRKGPYDFDGDGRSDISVFRPSNSVWYLNRSTEGFTAVQFGLSTDRIVPADYDGDGKTDIAVYRDGTWWLLQSTDGVRVVQFGIAGDLPVPADYTGDGRDEIAIYRGGQWWMLDLSNGQVSVINFGISMDKPVPADYDGDGKVDQAVYREGQWHLNRSNLGYTVAQFGISSDIPLTGDFDGDGRADEAVYRDGTWCLLQSTAGFTAFVWGLPTDIPTPADYDGDGKTDAAIYREGTWWTLKSTGGYNTIQFGLAGDKPAPAAFLPQ